MMIPEWLGAWVNPPTRYHGWWFPHSTFASEDFVGKIPILTASVSSLCFIHQTQCQGSPQVQNPTAFPAYKRGDAGSSHTCGERSGVGEGAYLEQGTTLRLKLYMAWHLEKMQGTVKKMDYFQKHWKGINAKDCTERNCKRQCHLKKGSFLAKTKTDLTWDTGSKKVCAGL